MPRPKEFDRQEVLARAMHLFWEQGIENTSVQDLVDAMGIGRGSLYDTFGCKDQLFTEVLVCYRQMTREWIVTRLQRPGPATKVLREFFAELLDRRRGGETSCCLMTRAALMAAPGNPQIEAAILGFQRELEAAFADLIRRGIEAGQFRAGLCAEDSARFLLTLMQGMGIGARCGSNLDGVLRTAWTALT